MIMVALREDVGSSLLNTGDGIRLLSPVPNGFSPFHGITNHLFMRKECWEPIQRGLVSDETVFCSVESDKELNLHNFEEGNGECAKHTQNEEIPENRKVVFKYGDPIYFVAMPKCITQINGFIFLRTSLYPGVDLFLPSNMEIVPNIEIKSVI